MRERSSGIIVIRYGHDARVMATRGGPGKLFAEIREANHDNVRLGRTLLLFGVLSVVGGVGLLVATGVVRPGHSREKSVV